MSRARRILLISEDEFSGVRPALTAALQRAGCEVIYRRQSLRELGVLRYWYALRMLLEAVLTYGRRARSMFQKTRIAFVARSRVNTALVNRHPEIDVVMLLTANSGYGALSPRRRELKRFIYTDYMNLMSKGLPENGFDLDERKTHAEWNRLERGSLVTQDLIFVMGRHVKPAIEMGYGVDPWRVAVVGVGPGLDVDIVRDGGRKDPANRSILFVGKLAGVKGLAVLLEAFALARASHPDAVLHVVTGAAVAPVPGVVFHRELAAEALVQLFYRCNIFVMPSFKEPLGLVFLEAMWSKCACIGTRTGSMPEFIEEGVTGYLIEPGDSASLSRRLVDLLGDGAGTLAMGEKAYLKARGYWNWDATVGRMRSHQFW